MSDINKPSQKEKQAVRVIYDPPVFLMLLSAVFMGALHAFINAFFSVKMTQEGISSDIIGYADSAQALAMLALTVCLGIIPRIPLRILYGISVSAGATAMLGLAFNLHYLPLLLPLRFLLGIGTSTLFIACEYWLNATVDDQKRGRILAAYGMAIVAGMGSGPLLVPLLLHAGSLAFAAGTLCFIFCAMPALAALHLSRPNISLEHTRVRLWDILRLSPFVLAAALLSGIIESGLFAFLPVYALNHGLGATDAALMLTCLSWGGLAAQFPMGWIADRYSSRIALLIASFMGISGMIILPVTIEESSLLLWISTALWGGVLTTLYIVSMGVLGREHQGTTLTPATLAFIFTYGIGGFAGPSLTGTAMFLLGAGSMPWIIGIACAALFVFTACRMTKGKRL